MLLRDELEAIGKAPAYDEFLGKVLDKLRPELSDMKTSIIARPDVPSFEEVKNLLLSAEAMIERSLVASTVIQPSALPVLVVNMVRGSFSQVPPWPAYHGREGNVTQQHTRYRGQNQRSFGPRGRGSSRGISLTLSDNGRTLAKHGMAP
ncbi:hypothetical protein LIER_12054 [Lithospermum erythrorhizon]|uniref:Gag protein n=1 Tax=Lithospermum erythrorhizon TaxID=34254 RepID=A0AAV3PUC6_LITER